MEPIKDLELLITDGEKIAKLARLFVRLPDILQIVNQHTVIVSSAQKNLKEINEAVKAKELELANLNDQIRMQDEMLINVKQQISIAEKDAANAKNVANDELNAARESIKIDIDNVVKESKVAIAEIKAETAKKISDFKDKMQKAAITLDNLEKEHRQKIDAMIEEEKAITAKVERAKQALAQLKANL